MRQQLIRALDELGRGLHHQNWYGKTFRDFWNWFNAESDEVQAQATPAEAEAVRVALLDLRASADDGGYAVSTERLDETIERPM